MRHVQGVDPLAQFWYDVMTAAPDLVCTLKHTSVKIRTDGTSLIQCCFTLTGTKILPVPDPNDEKAMRKLAYYESLIALDRANISPSAAAMAAVAPEQAAAMLYAQRIAQLERSGQRKVSAAQLMPVEAVGATMAVATTVTVEDTVRAEEEDTMTDTSDITLLDRYVVVDATPSVSGDSANTSTCTSTAEAVVATASAYGPDSTTRCSGANRISSVGSSSSGGNGGYPQLDSTLYQHSAEAAVAVTAATTTETAVDHDSTHSQGSAQPQQAATKTNPCKGEEHALRRYLRAVALVKERRKAKRSKDSAVTDQWLSVAQEAFRNSDAVAVAELVGGEGYKFRDGGGGSECHSAGSVYAAFSEALATGTQRCLALAGGIDCVCSIDMHLSAENKVVALVLNYVT